MTKTTLFQANLVVRHLEINPVLNLPFVLRVVRVAWLPVANLFLAPEAQFLSV